MGRTPCKCSDVTLVLVVEIRIVHGNTIVMLGIEFVESRVRARVSRYAVTYSRGYIKDLSSLSPFHVQAVRSNIANVFDPLEVCGGIKSAVASC
ncbi:hypothetical protein KQX54_004609 [Cotesia glomerata]|uniref:Uncharacterized protein n=1 Tax=Cotesia glomerata TaxID=32391 RepID=A0AAV7J631_COTGL|nr:hypothetical protein KQX54_004609 [Cotesia glomerata]